MKKKLRSLSKKEYIDYASMSHYEDAEDVKAKIDALKQEKDKEVWAQELRVQGFKDLKEYAKDYKAWVESVLPKEEVEEYTK